MIPISKAFLEAAFNPDMNVRYPPCRSSAGDLIGFSRTPGLSHEARLVEARFAEKLSDWDWAIEAYKALCRKRFGEGPFVIDSETARALADPDVYDTPEQRMANMFALNGPAAHLTIEFYNNYLMPMAVRPGQKSVLMLMGAPGSGKTMALRKAMREEADQHCIIFERVMSQTEQVKRNIRHTLDAGKTVNLRLVLRRPEEHFRSVIKRGLDTGLCYPFDEVALRYGHCLYVFQETLEYYRKNPDPAVKIDLAFFAGEHMQLISDISVAAYKSARRQIGLPDSGDPKNMQIFIQGGAYGAFDLYEKTSRRIPDPFRTALFGDSERGMEQAQKPFRKTEYRTMTAAVVDEQNWQTQPWPHSAGRIAPASGPEHGLR